MVATRTLNPLHLEDLEPRRFEDLVRQLLYDFRRWHALEATGRSGSDEGFDARGWELVADDFDNAPDLNDEEGEPPPALPLCQWLVQCKREGSIGPTKLREYVGGLPRAGDADLYGLIFAASCEFSKKARDGFFAAARDAGFAEAHLWSRSEIEDQLMQPKNDHLLFAFFGVSLRIRERSVRMQVRARLATKREAKRKLQENVEVLIRDASDDRYPHLEKDKSLPRMSRGRWKPFTFRGCYHDGLRFLYRRHFAYLGKDNQAWDYAETINDAAIGIYRDPWHSWASAKRSDDDEARQEIVVLWDQLEQDEKGWYEAELVLPYENVVAIDEGGDEHFEGPHIYVKPFVAETPNGPFSNLSWITLETLGFSHSRRSVEANPDLRVQVFPRLPPEIEESGDIENA